MQAILRLQIACPGNPNRLFAQNIRLGIRGGLSIPSLQGGNTEISQGYKSRIGHDFGVFGDLALTRHFALELEAMFVGQGGIKDGMQPIPAGSLTGLPVPPDMTLYADFKNETVLNYLEFPLLAKYTIDVGKTFKLYVDGGPNVDFLTSAKTKTSGSSPIYVDNAGTPLTDTSGNPLPPVDFANEQNIRRDVHSVNFGLAGGLGIAMRLGRGELSLNGRGSYGLTNIEKDPSNGDNRTGCLVITLGIRSGFELVLTDPGWPGKFESL